MAQYLDIDEVRNYDVNGQTFDLIALIEALNETPEGWVHPESVKELHIGQIVYVWAMDRLRRGVVIKLGRTKASVAFTTQGGVDWAVRYRDSKGIRVADTAVQLRQIHIPATPIAEVEAEEFTQAECGELAQDFRVSGALTEDEIEENAAQNEAENLADAEAARDENEAEGGIYAGTEWASSPTTKVEPVAAPALITQGGNTEVMDKALERVRETTGSAVVKLLERVHDRIRQNHPEIPAVIMITGVGIDSFGGKWGHFRAQGWVAKDEDKTTRIHEMFMAGETLAKGSRQVLQTMLHESAHALNDKRGEQGTSRQGRWHNKTFLKTAQELGLEYKKDAANPQIGFSEVTLTDATVAEYADLLKELDQEIHLMVSLPGWLGGTTDGDDEDGGGENMGRKPSTGEPKTNTNNVKATCGCEEPNIIRMSRKVLDKRVVSCEDCQELFEDRS